MWELKLICRKIKFLLRGVLAVAIISFWEASSVDYFIKVFDLLILVFDYTLEFFHHLGVLDFLFL